MSQLDPNNPGLYAAREPVFPRAVTGRFRTLKWGLMAVMLGVYYILPWLRWDRGPGMPDQGVLVDLANRRFYFFSIEIWPHEFYFVAGLLVMAGLGLFLFTSALGRVWCGYACPQTVWTDLFYAVERRIDGDRNNQLRIHRAPWTAGKLGRRLVKWSIWLLIAVATGGAWVFYFTDAPTLLVNLLTGNAHPIAYTTIAVMTGTTYFFGAIAREQLCIYACPWPRIQAAMMDEDTLTVAYREWRGEPRGKIGKNELTKSDGGAKGDCIDCLACVNVCPMGIDIRDGQQLECITCALCIDACDEIMDKIGKPRGLVAYMALKDEAAERAGAAPKPLMKHILRPRTMLYFTLWAGFGIALMVALFIRTPLDVNVTPVRNPLFVQMADGSVRNTYEVRIRNMQGEERQFQIGLAPEAGAGDETFALALEGVEGDVVTIAPDQMRTQRVYVTTPRGAEAATKARSEIGIVVRDTAADLQTTTETVFNGLGARK